MSDSLTKGATITETPPSPKVPGGAQFKKNEKKQDGNRGTKWGPKQLTETKSGNSVEALCTMRWGELRMDES